MHPLQQNKVSNLKRSLFSISNQHGFILPYVLFITALTFILIVASINIYHDEIHITQKQTQQLKIETLFQMGHSKFKESLLTSKTTVSPVTYNFPYGKVVIKYVKMNENEYHLYFTINTDKGSTFTRPNRLFITSE